VRSSACEYVGANIPNAMMQTKAAIERRFVLIDWITHTIECTSIHDWRFSQVPEPCHLSEAGGCVGHLGTGLAPKAP